MQVFKNEFLHFLIIFILAIIILLGVYKFANECYEVGYLDACKDMYKNSIKYKLIENSDGSKEWVLK